MGIGSDTELGSAERVTLNVNMPRFTTTQHKTS